MTRDDITRQPDSDELRAGLNGSYPLDWGVPVPTRAEIDARYGEAETTAAFECLAAMSSIEPAVTRDVVESMPPRATAHQLECRVKSPQSLARKMYAGTKSRAEQLSAVADSLNDVLRYTMVVPEQDELVGRTTELVRQLQGRGWSVNEAHHSYVEGSRYRGIHAIMRTPQGADVEVQFHSASSAAVKKATTRLYEINRNPHRSRQERERARAECVVRRPRHSGWTERPGRAGRTTCCGQAVREATTNAGSSARGNTIGPCSGQARRPRNGN